MHRIYSNQALSNALLGILTTLIAEWFAIWGQCYKQEGVGLINRNQMTSSNEVYNYDSRNERLYRSRKRWILKCDGVW